MFVNKWSLFHPSRKKVIPYKKKTAKSIYPRQSAELEMEEKNKLCTQKTMQKSWIPPPEMRREKKKKSILNFLNVEWERDIKFIGTENGGGIGATAKKQFWSVTGHLHRNPRRRLCNLPRDRAMRPRDLPRGTVSRGITSAGRAGEKQVVSAKWNT